MVDVSDDLFKIYRDQTTIHGPKNSMFNTFSDGEGWADTKSAYKYSQINRRSNSNFNERDEKTLKLAGKNTLTFPKRQRFNENTEETIKEMKNSSSNAKLTMHKMQQYDQASQASKRSLTKSELSKFFNDGKKQIEANAVERLSQRSKKSGFIQNNLQNKVSEL